MRELVRTNDAVLVTAVEALLDGADIPHVVTDVNISVLLFGLFPRRILVPEDQIAQARRLLQDAGLGHELGSDSA